MRDCNSQLSPRADNSVISANISSLSSSWEQVRKARRPSCSTTRSSSSAKPSSASALSSARREATSNVVTCRRRPLSTGSFSAIRFPPHQALGRPWRWQRLLTRIGGLGPDRRVFPAKPEPRASTGPALAVTVEAGIAVDANIDQQAEAEHFFFQAEDGIRDQRQGHTDDRNEAHHHRRIDEHRQEEIGNDAKTQ